MSIREQEGGARTALGEVGLHRAWPWERAAACATWLTGAGDLLGAEVRLLERAAGTAPPTHRGALARLGVERAEEGRLVVRDLAALGYTLLDLPSPADVGALGAALAGSPLGVVGHLAAFEGLLEVLLPEVLPRCLAAHGEPAVRWMQLRASRQPAPGAALAALIGSLAPEERGEVARGEAASAALALRWAGGWPPRR